MGQKIVPEMDEAAPLEIRTGETAYASLTGTQRSAY
jgi:hypothetical protein